MAAKPQPKRQYAICVNNEGYATSLDVCKVYRVLRDDKAKRHGLLRIVDESGEDYLYSMAQFVPLRLPVTAERVLAKLRVSRQRLTA